MKKILKTSFFVFSFLALFYSNAFAFLEFQKEKILSTDVPGVRGINFKPDGSIMYITNRVANHDAYIVQYSLSTPFDISTATRTFVDGAGTKLTCSTDMQLPHAIEFKPDGTRMFITTNKDHSGNPGVAVYQFKLTTAWDTSTLDCEKIFEVDITGVGNEDQVRTLTFKPDGTRMFVGGKTQDKIREYILTTPFDLRSGVSVGSLSASLASSSDGGMRNIQLHSDGSILYVAGDGNNNIHKYTLSTPWDITTISSTSTEYELGSRVSHMRGFIFTANFTKLFVTNDAGSTASTNKIFEYSLACAGTITCIDASNNNDVKAIIEANVELSKRIIKNNTLPIFHRIEWLRRHKNKDNLSNLNAEIDFTNEKISKLVSALKSSKKEVDRSYESEDWFQWSEGRVSLGKNKSINSSSRDFHSYGISVGADKIKDDDRDAMHGYVFQYANDNVDIGSSGTKLETDAYSFALYDTKLRDDHVFTDALIGVSLLDIDQKRVIYGNILEGNREGQQIYGSFNFGKRIVDEDLNLNPGIKLDLGYTKLKAFRERTVVGDSLADALLYKEQNIKSALITLGVLLDKTDTDKEEDEIINHHGRLEYITDLSPSSDAEFYYLNSQSTVYNYNVENKSKHNLRIGYGFDVTSITGWSFVGNFERLQSNGKGYSNDIYLSVGYVPIDAMKFVFDLNNFENTSFSYKNNINGFDLKMSSNYNFISDVPDYGTNIEISNKF
ncbi:autotransporter outer membrane beta-barrel domain-containing protein [Candidatus Pelagibacter communis]|uniref:autotransporter outer membrane beta-barrel domain-containing protein n=1 Tax=Pelagibacter ubique TaxID=198252 RepID=UPI0004249F4C|nr:autotransporter outer membrane beta-barrel domain-containing protein [Candidatus Pelagibacter ubique]